MELKKVKNLILKLTAVYFCLALIIFFAGGFRHYFWTIVFGVYVLAVLLCIYWYKRSLSDHVNPLTMLYEIFFKYSFLLK